MLNNCPDYKPLPTTYRRGVYVNFKESSDDGKDVGWGIIDKISTILYLWTRDCARERCKKKDNKRRKEVAVVPDETANAGVSSSF